MADKLISDLEVYTTCTGTLRAKYTQAFADALERIQQQQAKIEKLREQCSLADKGLAEQAKQIDEQQVDMQRLNEMLRETGYGQGQIDAYADQCEQIERLQAVESIVKEADARFGHFASLHDAHAEARPLLLLADLATMIHKAVEAAGGDS